MVCNHCEKPGHTKSQCYRLHGFLANFKFTKSKREEPKSTVQNAIVDSNSGISQEQFQQLMMLLQNNNINSPSFSFSAQTSLMDLSMESEGTFSFKKFAANVYKSSSLLQPFYSWIVDTGATYHMCSNKTLFLSLFKLLHPHFIGGNVCVSFAGNVKLRDSLIL